MPEIVATARHRRLGARLECPGSPTRSYLTHTSYAEAGSFGAANRCAFVIDV